MLAKKSSVASQPADNRVKAQQDFSKLSTAKSKKQKDYSERDYPLLKGISLDDLIRLSPTQQLVYVRSKIRRSMTRQYAGNHMARIRHRIERKLALGKQIRTGSRDLIVLPAYIGKVFNVHNGRTYQPILISPVHVYRRLGQFAATTRPEVKHGQLGKGATQASKKVSLT
jgi:small subunit ribosomal protein S19